MPARLRTTTRLGLARAGVLAALIAGAPLAWAQGPDAGSPGPPDTPARTVPGRSAEPPAVAGSPQAPLTADAPDAPNAAGAPDAPATPDASATPADAAAPGGAAIPPDRPAVAPEPTVAPATPAVPAAPAPALERAPGTAPSEPDPALAAPDRAESTPVEPTRADPVPAGGAPASDAVPAAAPDAAGSGTAPPDPPPPSAAAAPGAPLASPAAPGADPLAGVIADSEGNDASAPGAQSALPATGPAGWDAGAPVLPFAILGTQVLPGSQARLAWTGAESFAGIATPTPVLVTHGARRGPVLCLTAAVHGDELNGIEVVRRVYYDLRPSELRGTIVGVPIVNLPGFQRASRYLPDRRDLNRYFPGHPRGSAAGRIAHSFFNQVVLRCGALVDLHTGSLHRTNLPHVRANMADEGSWALAESFGGMPLLHDPPIGGTLRDAAAARGIAAVTIEAGSPQRLESSEVRAGVRAVQSLLATLGMTDAARPAPAGPVYESSFWVRAESGGILLTAVQPGARVRAGQRLGTVADPITNARVPIVAPVDGTVLGMALDQVVMPGFATHHLGVERTVAADAPAPDPMTAPDAAPVPASPDDAAPPADPSHDPAPEGRPE